MRRALAIVVTVGWFVFLAVMILLGIVGNRVQESAPTTPVEGFESETTPSPGEGAPESLSGLPDEGPYQGAPVPDGFEAIDELATDITIERDGDLAVVETIVYDFDSVPNRHGIYRFVPVRFRYDDRHDRIYPVEDVRVTGSPGTPTGFETGNRDQYLYLKIGDADTIITGVHTYEISYTVRGAVNAFEEWDELYWNVVGDQWDVRVRSATATVRVESGEITAARCFAGPTGSRFSCAGAVLASPPTSATFAQTNLPAYAGMTVVVSMPKGTVASTGPILDERWTFSRAFSVTAVTVAGAVGFLLLGTVTVLALGWTRGRDRRRGSGPATDGEGDPVPMFDSEPTPVEFRPPDGILPGQVGTLLDEVANPLDVTATIVDLAVRERLRIEEIPKEGWFGKTDWILHKASEDTSDLTKYERRLFDALFRNRSEVKLSDLRTTFHEQMGKVQDDLYVDMVDQGWFPRRPDEVRSHWALVGAGTIVLGAGLTALAALFTTLGIVPLGILASGILLTVAARWMPHRTPAGTAMLGRVRGFRRFIETAETERMRFAEEENIFARYLPYAIVFDLVEKWAEAFAGLGRDPGEATAYFYVAPYAFDARSFTSAMDNFTTTTGGTLVSTPSSSGSSGFSGGGFSGGGGGGGGGGSW